MGNYNTPGEEIVNIEKNGSKIKGEKDTEEEEEEEEGEVFVGPNSPLEEEAMETLKSLDEKEGSENESEEEEEEVVVDENEFRNCRITDEDERLQELDSIKKVSKQVESIKDGIARIMRSFYDYKKRKKFTNGIIHLERNVYRLGKDVAQLDAYFKTPLDENIRKGTEFNFLKTNYTLLRSQIFNFFGTFENELNKIYEQVRSRIEEEEEGESSDQKHHFQQLKSTTKSNKSQKFRVLEQQKHEMRIERIIETEYRIQLKEYLTKFKMIQEMMNQIHELTCGNEEKINEIGNYIQSSIENVNTGRNNIEESQKNRPRSVFEKAISVYQRGQNLYHFTKKGAELASKFM